MTSLPRRIVRRRSARLAVCLLGAVLAGGSGVATDASGASPEPSAVDAQPDIEAWLDAAIPPEAPVGKPVQIGLTLWDRARQQLGDVNSLTVHLRPAKGRTPPSSARATADWPGHLIAEIVVPRGGPGQLAYGIDAQVCTSDGACSDQETLVPFSGTGPPPDAPRAVLVVARLQQLASPVLAGEPIDLSVVLEPHASWDPSLFGLPDRVVAIANAAGGASSFSADVPATGQQPSPTSVEYGGQITLDHPGEWTLQIAIPNNGAEDQVIPGTTTRFLVSGTGVDGPAASARSAGPASPAAPPSVGGDGLPWIPIGVIVLGAGALIIRKVFADL